ncbi:hypothetical protein V5O48_010171 [Marasmius crinis-equi]|uniref:Uncharacterized protein n=1 Tax=Marasmius crinis-equi TaxID=585013 RepID=A0ABR3F977_9AGAR
MSHEIQTAPVSPFDRAPYNVNTFNAMDTDLCDLLRSLSLASEAARRKEECGDVTPRVSHQPTLDVQDEVMSDDSQSDTTSESSNPSNQPTQSRNDSSTHNEIYGCAYLKILQGQIALDGYSTTGGDYLEAIFTHREIFTSFPPSHTECARAFSDIAFSLERRAWRADRDADTEAVAAFRHESWMIAAYQTGQKESTQPVASVPAGRSPVVCVMQPVL